MKPGLGAAHDELRVDSQLKLGADIKAEMCICIMFCEVNKAVRMHGPLLKEL